MINLTYFDLLIASGLVVFLALCTWRLQPWLAGQLVTAAVRTAVQLFLVGFALKALFAHSQPALG